MLLWILFLSFKNMHNILIMSSLAYKIIVWGRFGPWSESVGYDFGVFVLTSSYYRLRKAYEREAEKMPSSLGTGRVSSLGWSQNSK